MHVSPYRSLLSRRMRTRVLLLALLMVSAAAATPSAQYGRRRREPRSYINPNSSQALKQWFPAATSFSNMEGRPPHITAYGTPATAGAAPAVLGFAFWTTDLVPNEVGYHGAIKMLVGLTPSGRMTGVVVDSDTEPFGYFSVETAEFARQFAGKSILDRFRVGDDVDAVSRASISVGSATGAIRDSVHLMARALLNPADVK
jgi:NosR/NirI family transcriptional regulator, nitrous oxide reductase regulator